MKKRSGLFVAVVAVALLAISASPVLAGVGGPIYLHAAGFDGTAPTAAAPQHADSGPLNYAGGNPWHTLGVWSNFSGVSASGKPHLWLGLRNSDDQGTAFDLRFSVLHPDVGGISILVNCVTRVTRNPTLAKDFLVNVTFNDFEAATVKVEARIGTTGPFDGAPKCGSHASAAGLRLYFDSVNRPSGIY